MEKFNEFIVADDFLNTRLDKYLSVQLKDVSRSYIQKLINSSNVQINDQICCEQKTKLKAGDVIKIIIKDLPSTVIEAKPMNLDIVFEDEHLLIINKPKGVTVHPGAGNHNDTLVNGLMHYCNLSDNSDSQRPGIVHRLDRDTTGLLVIAKNNIIHSKLSELLANREIKREYLALVYGQFLPPFGKIETFLDRCSKDRTKRAVYRNKGKRAVTHFFTEQVFYEGAFSMIKCILETGRTHQIRVHMTHKKHPIIGDQLYGKSLNFSLKGVPEHIISHIKQLKRQALHAYKLSFIHPITEESLSFSSPLPEDIKQIID